MKRIFFALFWLLPGCVTAPSVPNYEFPAKFRVQQLLDISFPDQNKVAQTLHFLATLERDGERFHVVLWDVIWQTKLVELDLADGTTNVKMPPQAQFPPQFDPKLIMKVIETFYETVFANVSEGKYVATTHGLDFVLSDFKAADNCRFPQAILIRYEEKAVDLHITTKELECSK